MPLSRLLFVVCVCYTCIAMTGRSSYQRVWFYYVSALVLLFLSVVLGVMSVLDGTCSRSYPHTECLKSLTMLVSGDDEWDRLFVECVSNTVSSIAMWMGTAVFGWTICILMFVFQVVIVLVKDIADLKARLVAIDATTCACAREAGLIGKTFDDTSDKDEKAD